MKILLVGPQGSGKTTQAALISQKFNIGVVIIGDMLRKRAQMEDDLGAQIRRDQSQGVLVADVTVATILKQELVKPMFNNGFVIDGWPRTIDQMKLFDPGYELVLNLVISEEAAIERLTKRGRQDDTPDAIKRRLSIYNEQTKQVLDIYRKKQLVVAIDGNQSVEDVSKQIEKEIKVYEQRAK